MCRKDKDVWEITVGMEMNCARDFVDGAKNRDLCFVAFVTSQGESIRAQEFCPECGICVSEDQLLLLQMDDGALPFCLDVRELWRSPVGKCEDYNF